MQINWWTSQVVGVDIWHLILKWKVQGECSRQHEPLISPTYSHLVTIFLRDSSGCANSVAHLRQVRRASLIRHIRVTHHSCDKLCPQLNIDRENHNLLVWVLKPDDKSLKKSEHPLFKCPPSASKITHAGRSRKNWPTFTSCNTFNPGHPNPGVINVSFRVLLRLLSTKVNYDLNVSIDTNRVVFNLVSKVISRLLWFCITALCDWLTKLAPLSQPMRIQTRTNRAFAARVFPRLAPVTCICFQFWLDVVLFTSVVIGQSNYFGFGFTTLDWKPQCFL